MNLDFHIAKDGINTASCTPSSLPPSYISLSGYWFQSSRSFRTLLHSFTTSPSPDFGLCSTCSRGTWNPRLSPVAAHSSKFYCAWLDSSEMPAPYSCLHSSSNSSSYVHYHIHSHCFEAVLHCHPAQQHHQQTEVQTFPNSLSPKFRDISLQCPCFCFTCHPAYTVDTLNIHGDITHFCFKLIFSSKLNISFYLVEDYLDILKQSFRENCRDHIQCSSIFSEQYIV